jgi:lipopolysaccharide/colanic/teichoic acid biosynthesis glycosyltransferase
MDIISTEKKKPSLLKRFTNGKTKKDRVGNSKGFSSHEVSLSEEQLKEIIDEERGKEVRGFFEKKVNLSSDKTFITSTTTRFNILKLPLNKYETIINLKRVNNFRWINKFFEIVNEKLPLGGIYINSVEVYTNRKKRIFNKSFFPLNRLHYFFDVVFTRLFPKLPVLKKFYFWYTRGENRVLSKAETFGRLYSCGFEVIEEETIGNELFFVARKKTTPAYDLNPTYGAIIRLKRHGKGGQLFNVYKLRTMHAYAEYLQEYVFEKNHLKEGGKFKDDFRITTEGRFFRKFWLDELPMFINVLKGDMKLVGVRPLSKHYFNLYTEELKTKRIKYKPGLVPPFYVDLPKTLDEIMDSEMRYLDAYEKHPVLTDIKYFFKAFYNIAFKRARSA